MMAYPIAMTAAMNWAVPRWDRINVTKRNISVVNRLVFAYRLHGIAMVQTTVTTIPMKRTAAKYHAPPISTNATIHNAYSKVIFHLLHCEKYL